MGTAPDAIAAELVRWANEQGGHDNITAALARVATPVDTVHTDEAARPTRHRPQPDRGATVAEFRTEVFQNEFLSDGATDVHAIVTVTSSGAGDRRRSRQRAASPRSSSSTPRGR